MTALFVAASLLLAVAAGSAMQETDSPETVSVELESGLTIRMTRVRPDEVAANRFTIIPEVPEIRVVTATSSQAHKDRVLDALRRIARVKMVTHGRSTHGLLAVVVTEFTVDRAAHYRFRALGNMPRDWPDEIFDYTGSSADLDKGLQQFVDAYSVYVREFDAHLVGELAEAMLNKNPAEEGGERITDPTIIAERQQLKLDELVDRAGAGESKALVRYLTLMEHLNGGQVQFGRRAFQVLEAAGDQAFAEASAEIRYDCRMFLAVAFNLVDRLRGYESDVDEVTPWRDRFPETSLVLMP